MRALQQRMVKKYDPYKLLYHHKMSKRYAEFGSNKINIKINNNNLFDSQELNSIKKHEWTAKNEELSFIRTKENDLENKNKR